VGSCRRELLDHVIAVNEIHLKRLLALCRLLPRGSIHCGLQKQTPKKRRRCAGRGRVIAWPRVGVFISVTNTPPELVATLVPGGLIDSSMHNAMCCCPPCSPAVVLMAFDFRSL
jgi:hypothetical protein